MIDEIRELLARHLPAYEVRSVAKLEGLDNKAYEVNGGLIVRYSKEADPDRRGEAVRREADLLAAVTGLSPLPVPEPVFVDVGAGVLAYAKLPGVPLAGNPVADPERLALALGGFLDRCCVFALPHIPSHRVCDLWPDSGWQKSALSLRTMRNDSSRRGEGPPRNGRRTPPRGFGWRRQLLETALTLSVAFVLVFGFIKPAVADSYRIPSASMEPTLHGCTGCDNDRVMANKFIYRFTQPERGQVVVFESVENDEETLIKRVVGVAGDTIRLKGGTLYVNGEPQEEPYVHTNPCVAYQPKTCTFGPVRVPQGHVFVMGDNRANSHDSRFFGAVPLENVEGEAFLRYWPPGRVGPL